MIEKPVRYIESLCQGWGGPALYPPGGRPPHARLPFLGSEGSWGVRRKKKRWPCGPSQGRRPSSLSGGAGPGAGDDGGGLRPGRHGSQLAPSARDGALIERYNPACELEEDGGISGKTAPRSPGLTVRRWCGSDVPFPACPFMAISASPGGWTVVPSSAFSARLQVCRHGLRVADHCPPALPTAGGSFSLEPDLPWV